MAEYFPENLPLGISSLSIGEEDSLQMLALQEAWEAQSHDQMLDILAIQPHQPLQIDPSFLVIQFCLGGQTKHGQGLALIDLGASGSFLSTAFVD
ncbi:hypothetical protein O181_020456 [Austropuccinia psidii MF-1]|uniref:Uncharacterized protein n=1 Tax=Austropuccinia psidii MF-1 TaxID=1389203 RepID=A0A9Q3CDH8_9BASI|nr:hypothetical protein [Austropuccinia psidii MF-1]